MKQTVYTLYVAFFLFFNQTGLNAQIPTSDAVYHQLTREYTLNPDGSVVYRFIKVQELITYRSFHNLYGETFIVYDPAWQNLKVNTSYTLMADGKKVITPPNAFNEVLPFFAANAPAYNGFREMVITHTGLERQAKIHLDYEIHSKPPVITGLWGSEILAEADPVNELVIKVRVPAGRELWFEGSGQVPAVEKAKEGNYDLYTWRVLNAPVVSPEEYQVPGWRGYPRIVFSTSRPAEAIRELSGQPAFRFEPNSSMQEVAGRLAKEEPDLLKRALKIQEMIAVDLRNYAIPFRNTGGLCRTPSEVWNSNGGTSCEKAALMVTLLKLAEITARPVVVATKPFEIVDFAVEITLPDHGVIIVPVNQVVTVNLLKAGSDKYYYPFEPGKEFRLTEAKETRGEVRIKGSFLISSDPRLTGRLTIHTGGAFNPYPAVVADSGRLKQSIGGGIGSSSFKEIKEFRPEPEFSEQTWVVDVQKPFRQDSNLFYFQLPVFRDGIDGWNLRNLSWRRIAPVDIACSASEEYIFELSLPADIRLFQAPRKTLISNGAGMVESECRLEEGKVIVYRKIVLKDKHFEVEGKPSPYEEFKALMDVWNNPRGRELVFIRDQD